MDRAGRNNPSNELKDVEIRIRRSNPDSQGLNESFYTVQYREGMTLHNALDYIYHTIDPSLAFRPYKCNKGVCMSCIVSINGKTKRACTAILKPGDHLLIEPAKSRPVIRDLSIIP
jgi:succinate dehydrogenase/fumarate reductase-like Fe-S protein